MAFSRARFAAILISMLSIVTVLAVAPPSGAATPALAVSPAVSSAVGETANQVVTPSPGVIGSIDRLYLAIFKRWPDEGGRAFWFNDYMNGRPLPAITDWFMSSPEWNATYGGAVDNNTLVELLYNNVLGRAPEPEGRAFWVGQLDAGVARNRVVLGFSESAEFVAKTGTAMPQAPPPPPKLFPALPANSGAGRRIVYHNSQHRVWLVDEYERVVDSYLVSGRRVTPGAGTYQVYSKSPLAWAGHDGITMNHMVRFAHGRSLAIGFHGIPRYANGAPMQTQAQLGSWRSSGCIRQNDGKAEQLYNWAHVGTTVVVLH